jgi:hypothetical protein
LKFLTCSFTFTLMAACSFFEGPVIVGDVTATGEEDAGVPEVDEPDAAPPREDDPEPGSALLLSPRHGQVVGGTTAEIPLVVAGKSSSAEELIEVQVLSNPRDLNSWTTIATTTANTESDGDVELGFAWSVSISPEDRGIDSWVQGGLLRLRVLANEQPAAVLSHDADACIAQIQANEGRALACAAKKESGIVLVSPVVAGEGFPAYLAQKGLGSLTATQLYYLQTDAPATYEEFMARYIDGTSPIAKAVYLNDGDLAVGRNLACSQFPDGALTGVACMTGNFGAFSGDPGLNLNLAIAGHEAGDALGAFAFVAMVYQPSRGTDNMVSFVVYGPDGARIDAAALDTRGDVEAIPNNCLNCHGSGSSFDPATGIATGASFLPLDALQLSFPANLLYTLEAQSESIRQLNQLVSQTALNDTTQGVLDEMYPGGVDVPGSLMYPSDTPATWSASARSAETYRNVIAPSCRGCHMTGTLDFSTEELFRTTGQGAILNVCGTHAMPNAEVVVSKFWSGPGRAYLVDFFDVADPCAPPLL